MGLVAPPDDFLLRDVWCRPCARRREPATVDGIRFYACGLGCPRRLVAAVPVEQDALLAAYVRANVALNGVGRPSQVLQFSDEPEHWHNDTALEISEDELRLWHGCDFTDRAAVLAAAFVRVETGPRGETLLVWRREPQEAQRC